jgi:nucleotide-binding universal stress UspA family protein
MPGIIVGVDGSDRSRRALGWAMLEALQRGVPLTVMTVIPGPVRSVTTAFWGTPTHPEERSGQVQALRAVQAMADKAAKETEVTISITTGDTAQQPISASPGPGTLIVRVTVHVATGETAEELIKASRDTDMLVIGTRGSSGFAKFLKGSVSSRVTHQAACPVTVIPGTQQAS